MRRVAIVSDTHIPDRERAMPDTFRKRIGEADHAIHAGDFRSKPIVDRIGDMADGNFTAVRGNVDARNVDLPEVATLDVGDVTFVVTHGHRHRRSRRASIAELVRETAGAGAVGVFGHTHRPTDEGVDGVRLLNPGSATGARPASVATMLTVDVDGAIVDATLHEA